MPTTRSIIELRLSEISAEISSELTVEESTWPSPNQGKSLLSDLGFDEAHWDGDVGAILLLISQRGSQLLTLPSTQALPDLLLQPDGLHHLVECGHEACQGDSLAVVEKFQKARRLLDR